MYCFAVVKQHLNEKMVNMTSDGKIGIKGAVALDCSEVPVVAVVTLHVFHSKC